MPEPPDFSDDANVKYEQHIDCVYAKHLLAFPHVPTASMQGGLHIHTGYTYHAAGPVCFVATQQTGMTGKTTYRPAHKSFELQQEIKLRLRCNPQAARCICFLWQVIL